MKLVRSIAVLGTLAATLLVSGCDSFERNTFNTLASAQSVLNQAQSDYEARVIPKTQCSFAIITDAKTADGVAVQAMVTYEQMKAAKGNLDAQQAIVVADLAKLGGLVAQVQQLGKNGACTGGVQ